MKEGIDDCFTEGIHVEKPDFLPFDDSIPLIGLEDIDDVSISKNFIQRIEKTLISEFTDGIKFRCLGLAGEYRHPDRHLGIVGEKLGKEVIFPIFVPKIKILLKRLIP